MWPKLLPQLLEMLPHLSRLLPVADKYMAQRAQKDAQTETALHELQTSVRMDLGKVARAHMELAGKLDQFAGHVDEIGSGVRLVAEEAARARAAAELARNHAAEVEAQVRALRTWVKLGLLVIVLLLIVLCVLVLREHPAAI